MNEIETTEDKYYCPLCGERNAYITLVRHVPSDRIVDFKCSMNKRCILMPLAISLVEKSLEKIIENKKEINKTEKVTVNLTTET